MALMSWFRGHGTGEPRRSPSALTAHKVDLKYHPLKSLKLTGDNLIEPYLTDSLEVISRQQLESTFIRNGACYAIKPDHLCLKKSFFKGTSRKISI